MDRNKYKKKRFCKQCGKEIFSADCLCRKHREQLSRFGKFLDNNPRSKRDPNEIILHKDYGEVITYDINNNPFKTFKFDLEDLPIIQKYKWCSTKRKGLYYLTTKEIGLFHRYIMGSPRVTVDHINRDTTDNRKQNLRLANYSEQNLNKRYKSNRFDIKGIDIHKDIRRKKRYMARFSFNKKMYQSPWYETYEEAVYARFLLEKLAPVVAYNGDMNKYISKLSSDKQKTILNWFINRFNNRVQ